MKKLIWWIAIISAILLCGCSKKNNASVPLNAAPVSDVSVTHPILITSFGQSIDSVILKTVFDNINEKYTYSPTVDSSVIADYKTVIIAVGASKKGVQNANLNMDDELKRCEALVKHIEESDTTVIVVHLGGKNRRGKLSDQFINAALKTADEIIVVDDGDYDGIFSDYAEANTVPLIKVKELKSLQQSFDELLK